MSLTAPVLCFQGDGYPYPDGTLRAACESLTFLPDAQGELMKPVSEWVSNWTGSAPRATAAYTKGVQSTSKDWAGNTVAAIPSMVQGFNEAANNGTIAAGIRNAGTGYWQSQTVAKAGSFSQGLTLGADNYAAAAQKLATAISSGVSGLPARGPVGSEQNYGRSRALGIYLHDRKGSLGAR